MAWLDEIPLEQKEIVDELRKRTVNECTPKMLLDPSLFYRFSKGCNFNLKNAESMLRKHILWRKENGIDTILTDFKCPEVFENYMPFNRIGYDKEGCPVNYSGVGKADVIGIGKSCRKIDALKYSICMLEKDCASFHEQRQKTGRLIVQSIYIHNVEGMTLQKATNKPFLEVAMQSASIFQNNYPEFVKAIYIINASRYFSVFFSFIKLVISSGLIRKLHIFGTDGWKEKLLELIDEEVLPSFLGGKRTDPDGDPLCKSFICHGGQIPEKYFLSSIKKTILDHDGVKKVTATRRSSTDVIIEIVEPSSVFMWEFETKNGDIMFGIKYRNPEQNGDGEDVIELVPKKRIDASKELETGTYVCKKAGLYILVFDNTYSWIYSKEIYYRTNVIPPTKD